MAGNPQGPDFSFMVSSCGPSGIVVVFFPADDAPAPAPVAAVPLFIAAVGVLVGCSFVVFGFASPVAAPPSSQAKFTRETDS